MSKTFKNIFEAIKEKRIDELEKFLDEAGSEKINARDSWGRTALIVCAQLQFEQGLELLLKRGASLNERDEEGVTALIAAASRGWPEGVRLLLIHGANPLCKERTRGQPRDAWDWAMKVRSASCVALIEAALEGVLRKDWRSKRESFQSERYPGFQEEVEQKKMSLGGEIMAKRERLALGGKALNESAERGLASRLRI